jgi:hypothetical protein
LRIASGLTNGNSLSRERSGFSYTLKSRHRGTYYFRKEGSLFLIIDTPSES